VEIQVEVTVRKFLIPLSFLCVITFSEAAEQGQPQALSDSKPAWKWTDEERLGARFAPGAAARRLAASNRRQPSQRAQLALAAAGDPEPGDFVDGALTPELFLRWELFDELLASAFRGSPEGQAVFRDGIVERVPVLKQAPGLWDLIAAATSDYLRALTNQATVASRLTLTTQVERQTLLRQLQIMQRSNCNVRVQSLRKVSADLGAETFDRLLYQGVAATMFKRSVGHGQTPEALSYIERGCQ
jgi:hypothetical protein